MKKQLVISAVVAVVLTVVLVGVALSLLFADGPSNSTAEGPAGSAAPEEASEAVAQRPDCPAGFDLPCLGGGTAGELQDVAIVNVWAWWCEPCRAELPLLARVAEEHPEWSVVGVHADKSSGRGADLLNELGSPLASYADTENAFGAEHELPRVIPITLVFKGGEEVGRFVKPFESVEEIEAAVEGVL